MATIIDTGAKVLNSDAITAQLIRDKSPRTAPTLHQFTHKTGRYFTISSALHEDFERVSVLIVGSPKGFDAVTTPRRHLCAMLGWS